MVDPTFKAEADRIIELRIDRLRPLTYAQAQTLAEATSEEVEIAGKKSSVTVFRQEGPYGLKGRILVTVLVARPRWFGMTSFHVERGLVFSQTEATREATSVELQNSGG